MNRTNIEWTNWSWNPVTGCLHGCEYCYARKLTQRFPKMFPYGFDPHFYPDRLKEPYAVTKPSRIFTVSMGDMFGNWVLPEWIAGIRRTITDCTHHQFQILTKAPWNILNFVDFWPKNTWLGTTIENQTMCDLRLDPLERIDHPGIKFVSFEPLQGEISCDLSGIDWIIIGAQTNPDKPPTRKSVTMLMSDAEDCGCKVFLKNNLLVNMFWHEYGLPQDFPEVR